MPSSTHLYIIFGPLPDSSNYSSLHTAHAYKALYDVSFNSENYSNLVQEPYGRQ